VGTTEEAILLAKYAGVFLHYWVAIMTGGAPLAFDFVLRHFSRRYTHWAETNGPWRRTAISIALLGAVLWAGYATWREEYTAKSAADRAATSARHDEGYWYGVAQSERHDIEGPAGYLAQLATQARSGDRPPQIRPTDPLERTAARLKITDFSFGAPDASGRVQLVVHVKNDGITAGAYPVYNAKLFLSDSALTNLSREAPYQAFLMEALARPPSKDPVRGQLEPGDDVRDSIAGVYVTKDEVDAVRSGAKHLNIFIVMKYRDLTTNGSAFWVSEYCAEQAKDFRAYYECDTHNRIWLQK
jgi:hypothetical protein